MHCVELMKGNFALTCRRNGAIARQPDINGGQNKHRNDIYMGVTKYKPKQRFTGLFPLQDILTQTVDQVSKFVPGSDITDAAGIPSDLKALQQAILAMKQKDKTSNNMLYVKFSYLPEDGMVKVGSKTVSFGRILEKMQQSNRALRR